MTPCQGLASGTILYVVMFEVLQILFHHHLKPFYKLYSFIATFTISPFHQCDPGAAEGEEPRRAWGAPARGRARRIHGHAHYTGGGGVGYGMQG